MSYVRSCKGRTVRTESKDLAPHHHFTFLISNFSFKRSFHTESKGAPPYGLTLNPEPRTRSLFPFPFPLIYGNMVAIDYIYNEVQE